MSAGSSDLAPRAALAHGADALGIPLTAAQLDAFDAYSQLLREGKQEASLTSLTDPLDIAVKHFVDSLTLLLELPLGPLRVIDVGSGAGFPGLPVKIVRPEVTITFVESTAKKARWVERTAAELGLSGVTVLDRRAEEVGREPAHRGRYDAATARAVAPLPVLFELCLPLLRAGGLLVAMKTENGVAAELPRGQRALDLLGGRLVTVRHLAIAELPNRTLVVVQQEREAPDTYPRRPGIPNKRPL